MQIQTNRAKPVSGHASSSSPRRGNVDDADAVHKALLAESPLGRPVTLTDGRMVGRVVEVMQWPWAVEVRKGALPARSTLLGIQWVSRQVMELAREAEVAVARDGVFLVGDERGSTQKAKGSGWGRRLASGETRRLRFS